MADAKDIANRVPITVALMLSSLMNSLDTTIANVALPHIQGSVGAAPDQITWVLTSYLIAAAIMTPLSGWLSVRVGRKLMFVVSILGFTVASMLCGLADSVEQIVAFRFLQGLFGASLIPLSQAVVLDLYPPAALGQVMALWGAATIMGPILGPFLGGWLTDNFSWRWCFYINLPVGVVAVAGVMVFMSGKVEGKARPFDFLGFGALASFIGAFQLIVDRGPSQDWFSSSEIWIYAVIAIVALYVFIVHTLSAKHPFFDRALARDRNFVSSTVFGFFIGVLLFSTMALLPPMMQELMGYSAYESGLVSMPRGVGSFVAMFIVGRLIGRVDTRLILVVGLCLSTIALRQMSQFLATSGPASAGVVPATAVVVLRHTALPLALDHAMWQKYKIGQSLSILDPETKAPAVKNPFLQPKPGVLTVDDMAIDRVLASGAVIGACAIALNLLSGKLAGNAGVSAEEAAKEWTANVIAGITVIPSGTWGLNRAQEHGCTYCAGG